MNSYQYQDTDTDPPPDLVLEVDITSSSVNKRRIYAALGVPEIWRYRKNKLQAFILDRDNCVYVESDRSFALP